MKKILIAIVAVAMIAAFVPIAQASETAQLGLSVTFKANEPLKLSTYPEGPFNTEEEKTLYFRVMAQDPDATAISLGCEVLPAGATFALDQTYAPPTTYISGSFSWTPKMGQGQAEPYKVAFFAKSELKNADGTVKTEEAQLVVEITVVKIEPVVSIELYPTSWDLQGVKLGELRTNYGYFNRPMHYINNTGNVTVLVDIGYGPQTDQVGVVRPGLQQGLDTFTTAVGMDDTNKGVIIPPNARVKVAHIERGTSAGLPLTYGAPTQLSSDVSGMSTAYELRAYGIVKETAGTEE